MKGKKVTINGVPLTVVSDAEAQKADYLVCALAGPSEFTDNLKGFCCECGREIMYRWHAPRAPNRICMECLAKKEGLLPR